jgi:hypothetical protein
MDPQKIWGVVRTVLAAVAGGWLAKKGFDGATVDAILGAVGVLFVAGWSIFSKKAA